MVATTLVTAEPDLRAARFRPELLRVFDGLPLPQQREVLNFARFLRQQVKTAAPPPQIELRTAPATTLTGLTGLVALGEDAYADTEALYNITRQHLRDARMFGTRISRMDTDTDRAAM